MANRYIDGTIYKTLKSFVIDELTHQLNTTWDEDDENFNIRKEKSPAGFNKLLR